MPKIRIYYADSGHKKHARPWSLADMPKWAALRQCMANFLVALREEHRDEERARAREHGAVRRRPCPARVWFADYDDEDGIRLKLFTPTKEELRGSPKEKPATELPSGLLGQHLRKRGTTPRQAKRMPAGSMLSSRKRAVSLVEDA